MGAVSIAPVQLIASSTHVVHSTGEVETHVGRREPNDGELADAAVLQLRLSEEVEGDKARETDRVEASVAWREGGGRYSSSRE